MKIDSSTVEFSSNHFLGTKERESVYASSTAAATTLEQESSHTEIQTDRAYELQLSEGALRATAAAVNKDVDFSKLSQKERDELKNVAVFMGVDSDVIQEEVSAESHTKLVVDQNSSNATIGKPPQSSGNWRQVGVIREASQQMTVGQGAVVVGQSQGETVTRQENAQLQGTSTEVGESTVFVATTNANGAATGLRIGEVETRTHTVSEAEYTAWSAQGRVTTEDGRTVQIDQTSLMLRSAEMVQTQSTATLEDPLVIQYGKGSAAVGLTEEKYAFDLDADGQKDSMSFVKPGAGFLALDQNGDGKINDGSELFGAKSGDAFGDLAKFDADGNGWIDENDDVYGKLRIWAKDDQGKDQLLSLKEADVGAIYLGSVATEFSLKDSRNELQGQVRQSGLFLRDSGEVGTVQRLDLATSEGNAQVASPPVSNGQDGRYTTKQSQVNYEGETAHVSVQQTENGLAITNNNTPRLIPVPLQSLAEVKLDVGGSAVSSSLSVVNGSSAATVAGAREAAVVFASQDTRVQVTTAESIVSKDAAKVYVISAAESDTKSVSVWLEGKAVGRISPLMDILKQLIEKEEQERAKEKETANDGKAALGGRRYYLSGRHLQVEWEHKALSLVDYKF
ncbi:hypothetical protein [Anaeroarcus burkinensis]|uniref:hypothetical protein n=1 Tax=Anaeroarcus burkinensis TaxID=82376 RepID=UPI00041668D6|nr:hypothetical protein [Anaeroarcus burkinensis]